MSRFCGSSVTVWRRLRNREEREVWCRIMQQLKKEVYRAVKISIDVVSIDSKTIVAKKVATASDTTDVRERKAQKSISGQQRRFTAECGDQWRE